MFGYLLLYLRSSGLILYCCGVLLCTGFDIVIGHHISFHLQSHYGQPFIRETANFKLSLIRRKSGIVNWLFILVFFESACFHFTNQLFVLRLVALLVLTSMVERSGLWRRQQLRFHLD